MKAQKVDHGTWNTQTSQSFQVTLKKKNIIKYIYEFK